MQQSGMSISFEQAAEDWSSRHAAEWRSARQAKLLEQQRLEIMKHKWIESEKARRDLGRDAVMDWITKYAAQWRTWYETELENHDK